MNHPPSPSVTPSAAVVRRLILEALGQSGPSPEGNPPIYGRGAPLDSLGLVNFLADLEYKLAQEFGRDLVLASERAMSRSQSPFRDADALTAYILELFSA